MRRIDRENTYPSPTLEEIEEAARRTLSVQVHRDLATFMVEYCRARGICMSSAVSDAIRSFLVENWPGSDEDDSDEPTLPDHNFAFLDPTG